MGGGGVYAAVSRANPMADFTSFTSKCQFAEGKLALANGKICEKGMIKVEQGWQEGVFTLQCIQQILLQTLQVKTILCL